MRQVGRQARRLGHVGTRRAMLAALAALAMLLLAPALAAGQTTKPGNAAPSLTGALRGQALSPLADPSSESFELAVEVEGEGSGKVVSRPRASNAASPA